MKKLNSGFTFVQLIIVLIIVAAIAVLAIPRFISQTSNARIAGLNGLVDAINNATMLSAAQYHTLTATSNKNLSSITANDRTITVMPNTGFPTASETGIGSALPVLSGFSVKYVAGTAVFNFNTPVNNCSVTYNETSGQATVNSSGC
jgi:MSHA pilin protein MshA